MVWFIIGIVLVVVAISILTYSAGATKRAGSGSSSQREAEAVKRGGRIVGIVLLIGGIVAGLFSMVYTQGVGEAKVITNIDGTIAGEKLDPGFGVKAPWQNTVDFDIFQQEVLYAGNKDGAPSYSGGEVNGAEVTAAVKRGAQAYIDISVVYSVNPDQVTEIYKEYRSQERFTRQVIIPSILSSLRDVPSAYTPVEFRGEKRGEATDKLLSAMNDKLSKYGVDVSTVNLQDVRYTAEVEDSIKAVEVAQQKEETAQAELRATEVSAQAQIIEAQAAADANRLLSESLTDQILQQKMIDAYDEGTIFVVPEGGAAPLINVNPTK